MQRDPPRRARILCTCEIRPECSCAESCACARFSVLHTEQRSSRARFRGIQASEREHSMTRRPGYWLLLALCCLGSVSGAAQGRDTRLIDAIRHDDVAAARALLAQRIDLRAADADGSTALHWAAQRNNLTLVELLLAAGGD